MSTSLKIAACVALLTACGGGGARPPTIHLDMGAKNGDGGMQNCVQPSIPCNGGCINPTNDNNNCGGCGNACPNNQTCQASTCTGGGCTGTQIMCNGACTDTSTDNNNCGSCGHVCTNGQNCLAKMCQGQMGGMTGCNGLVMCLNACAGDMTCAQNCLTNTTKNGTALFMTVANCLEQACPSSQGGVCDPNGNMAACSTCYMNAQMGNGACVQQITACDNDKP